MAKKLQDMQDWAKQQDIYTGTQGSNSTKFQKRANTVEEIKDSGNAGTGGNKGNGGGGTGAAAAPSVQATASGSASSYNPYDYDPVTGQILARPANEYYTPGQSVTDALAAMQASQAGQPGAYTASAASNAAQQAMLNAQAGQPGAYTPSAATNAAQQAMLNAQQGQPGAYTPSAEVLAAQQALQALQGNKPQGYTSQYAPQMEALLEQIQNPGQFNYEFNGDNLFKMYADEYTKRGKQASLDAMGQAAALTGGYGNSYAQQVANQAYDQNLTELYDRGLELRDRAYEAWLNEQQNKYNQFNLLSDADQTAYGRYRDEVGDWENERDWLGDRYDTERNIDYSLYRDKVNDYTDNRDYYTNQYNNERNVDYGQYRDAMSDYQNMLDYYTNQYNNEYSKDYGQYRDIVGDYEANRDYWTNQYNNERNVDYNQFMDRVDRAETQYEFDANMQENMRQFNENLNWDKMSSDQKYAADYAMSILASGEMPTEAMLRAAGLSAEDAKKLMAKITTGGGTGGTGGKEQKTYFTDLAGNYYEKDENGRYKRVEDKDVDKNALVDESQNVGISLNGIGSATLADAASNLLKKKKNG